jgi:hypothetical protein
MTKFGMVTAVFAAVLSSGTAMAAGGAPVCSAWDRVEAPNSGKELAVSAIDALDAANVWTVGRAWDAVATRDGAAQAMRWDGSAWAVEPLPKLEHLGGDPTLEAIAIAPTGDPWVVGRLRDKDTRNSVPLVLRWSHGFWEVHQVNLVNSFVPRYPDLRDVSVRTEDDAWTVGQAETMVAGALEPFAAHWDGTAWSEVVVPGAAAGPRVLTAVSIAGPNAAWAVGYDGDAAKKDGAFARIYRWDGANWSVAGHPVASKAGSVLYDVVALGANDVWAVGRIGTQGLFLHWNGFTWTYTATLGDADLRSVDGAAANDVWAAGETAVYHFDGTSWSEKSSGPSDVVARRALAVAGPCDAWLVGSRYEGAGSLTEVSRLSLAATPRAPVVPKAFSAFAKSPDTIVLTWLPGDDPTRTAIPTGFLIERCLGGAAGCVSPFIAIQKTAGNVTSYADSGLRPSTPYTYRIYALNDIGKSPATVALSVVTLPPDNADRAPRVPAETNASIPRPPLPGVPPPTPVAFVAKTQNSKTIALAWAPGGSPTGPIGKISFVIERCAGGAAGCATPFAAILKVPGTVTSTLDIGLLPGTAYTYRVYAVNDRAASAPTRPVTARTADENDRTSRPGTAPLPLYKPAPPSTPTGFTARAVSVKEIELSWDYDQLPTGPATGLTFVIERCAGEKECQSRFTVVGKPAGRERSFVDSGLKGNTAYTYRISAVNSSGSSDPTVPETARTFPTPAPWDRAPKGSQPSR